LIAARASEYMIELAGEHVALDDAQGRNADRQPSERMKLSVALADPRCLAGKP
jgi:hypothetical protein